ncbi:MAG: hypothetical protein IPJ06_03665 [Saprospiraceae bacterium]|nr:hypothetical protein [Saprospiraceae bacterium]
MTILFNRQRLNPFSSIAGILIMALVLVGLFFVAKGIFWLLAKAAVFLLAGALIIHYKTVLDFGKWLWNTIITNPLQGIFLTALGVLLYPILFAYLFLRALVNRKVSKLQNAVRQEREGEWVDFEELETTFKQRKQRAEKTELEVSDRYSDLFE